jgi:hypothetical protein
MMEIRTLKGNTPAMAAALTLHSQGKLKAAAAHATKDQSIMEPSSRPVTGNTHKRGVSFMNTPA